MFTTADCSGDIYTTNVNLAKNKIVPVTNTDSTVLWTLTNEVIVPVFGEINFISTWSSANGCQPLTDARFTGPLNVPNVYRMAPISSPLPAMTGSLVIGIQ
jgi:hypothetical protein